MADPTPYIRRSPLEHERDLAPDTRKEAVERLAAALDGARETIMEAFASGNGVPFGRRLSPVQATGLLLEAAATLLALVAERDAWRKLAQDTESERQDAVFDRDDAREDVDTLRGQLAALCSPEAP